MFTQENADALVQQFRDIMAYTDSSLAAAQKIFAFITQSPDAAALRETQPQKFKEFKQTASVAMASLENTLRLHTGQDTTYMSKFMTAAAELCKASVTETPSSSAQP